MNEAPAGTRHVQQERHVLSASTRADLARRRSGSCADENSITGLNCDLDCAADAVMEKVQVKDGISSGTGWRRKLLDRVLAWNQAPLQRILREYATHHNQRQPHRSLYGAASLKPATSAGQSRPVPRPRHTSVGGTINEHRLVA